MPPRPRTTHDLPLLLGAVACLLAAALYHPRERTPPDARPALRALVCDLSASVTRRRPGHGTQLRAFLVEELEAARLAGEEVLLVLFAERAQRAYGPGPAQELLDRATGADGELYLPRAPGGADEGSKLCEALRAADLELRAPGRAPGRCAVWSDGAADDGDPTALLTAWTRSGIEFELRAPSAPELGDRALLSLELPEVIEAGAPLLALVETLQQPGSRGPLAEAQLALTLRSTEGERELVLPLLAPPGGRGRAVQRVELGAAPAGRLVLEARLQGAGDAVAENDALVASARASGALSLGLVAPEELRELASSWIDPARLPGLAPVVLAPDELAVALPELDLVVSLDLPLGELPCAALAGFVRDGGGWFASGGWTLLERRTPGSPASELAELLPLEPVRGPEQERDLVLLIDGSGSMSGEPWDAVRRASLELAAAAPPGDRLLLRFFTASLRREHLLQRADEADTGRALRELLDQSPPRGPTDIARSLEFFAEERASSGHPALVFLITDGNENNEPAEPQLRAATIRAALDAVEVRLAPVAVGERADLDYLRHFLLQGEELFLGGALEGLGEFLRSEANRERLTEGEREPRALASEAPGDLRARIGVPDSLPGLSRSVRAEVRPGATLLWELAGEGALLAVAQHGAGRVAAWSSAPRPGWAPRYAQRVELLGGLLRFLGRGPERALPRCELTGERLRLSGLARSASAWPAELHVRLEAHSGREVRVLQELELTPSALAPRDVRVGSLALDALASLGLDEQPFLAISGADAPQGSSLLPVRGGLAHEFAPGRAQLAPGLRAGGAATQASLAAPHRLAPWLLGGALLALGLAGWRLARAGTGQAPRRGGR